MVGADLPLQGPEGIQGTCIALADIAGSKTVNSCAWALTVGSAWIKASQRTSVTVREITSLLSASVHSHLRYLASLVLSHGSA